MLSHPIKQHKAIIILTNHTSHQECQPINHRVLLLHLSYSSELCERIDDHSEQLTLSHLKLPPLQHLAQFKS